MSNPTENPEALDDEREEAEYRAACQAEIAESRKAEEQKYAEEKRVRERDRKSDRDAMWLFLFLGALGGQLINVVVTTLLGLL